MAMSRMSNINLSNDVVKLIFTGNDAVDVNQHVSLSGVSKKSYRWRHALSEHNKCSLSGRWWEVRKPPFCKSRRLVYFVPFASADDDITVNGTLQASSNSGMEEVRAKLNQSLQGENLSSSLVQSIHDAARAIELAIQKHVSSSKTPWFTKAWLRVDKHAWVKTLSYQVSVHALLQAALEISSRGERRDGDTNIFVQRSLMRQCAPLENVIRQELSAKQPSIYEWFWSHQHSMVVTTYVNLLESDPHFTAATDLCWKGESSDSDTVADSTLLMLALSCFAAVKKLGSAKLHCSHFSSMVPDTIGRLMDMLLDIVPIQKAYYSMKDIGLHREFLSHFGPRAALIRYRNNRGSEEIKFWIDLVQNQLQRAIDREKIWSRLTTCESIEVLEKDLAIFGFFIALGRSTQSFLSANGVSAMDDHIEGIIRYLIGGSVLYYPQLSSISSYQLYVEVVCEELDWLPFYQSNVADVRQLAETKGKQGGIPHEEAIILVLDVCSYWMTSFIKYSAWLENPSNIKATRFLSKGHIKLTECKREVGLSKMGRKSIGEDKSSQGSETHPSACSQLDSFDKALEGVEEALNRLEDLLQELHLSNSNTGKEHLKAACSDLERIRKLKKEAEFLEASFRAKAASLEQDDVDGRSTSSASEKRWFSNKESGNASKESNSARNTVNRLGTEPREFWNFLAWSPARKNGPGLRPGLSAMDQNVMSAGADNQESELNEICRFEVLRRELIELEKRVKRSTDLSQNEEESEPCNEDKAASSTGSYMIVHGQRKDDFITKSIEKIKKTSTDIWQGTQLLAIDVAAAMVLLRRALTGDELAEKEKKALQRTLTDLASVVPIGILMLLPVTAVGHAAMLAAIQRYVPSLIPSTYGPERLDLLRQLEKVKQTETAEVTTDDMTEAITSSGTSPQ